MNAPPLDPQRPAETAAAAERSWSSGRWMAYIALAFGLHIGLVFALGDRQPIQPRPVKNAAAIHTTTRQTEWQQLDDPTIFALPHPRGFAGATWLRLPEITFAPFRWNEPARLLPLPVAQLGTIFLRHAETNSPALRDIAATAPPAPTVLSPIEIVPVRKNSTLHINGGLTGRALRPGAINLPLQPARDGLTNTIVQVLVDERGQVVRATLLPPGSGAPEADQTALKTARNLRFSAQPGSTAATVGRLIFAWATTPPTPAATP